MNLRGWLANLLLIAITRARAQAWPPFDPDETYVLEPGDGSPDFMHTAHHVRATNQPWFPGQISGQRALLFVVVGGAYEGRYVALTPRDPSIEGAMSTSGMARVGVMVIGNPTSTFGLDSRPDFVGSGMTVLRRVGDKRFEVRKST